MQSQQSALDHETSVSWFLAIIGAVAPFAGAVAVLGGLAVWIRRRLAHRSQASS